MPNAIPGFVHPPPFSYRFRTLTLPNDNDFATKDTKNSNDAEAATTTAINRTVSSPLPTFVSSVYL